MHGRNNKHLKNDVQKELQIKLPYCRSVFRNAARFQQKFQTPRLDQDKAISRYKEYDLLF